MAEKAGEKVAAVATTTGDTPAEPAPPVKRGRGRPKGSKNKPKDPNAEPPVKVPKKRGRPPKAKPADEEDKAEGASADASTEPPPAKRPRGRPRKNAQ
ncbi:hypothetical protein K523DRAFT_321297 [Schizophyllum commune Tattone D]|nr:hypothetical protein K523DRAFT_321297 [Schizophyllum commune Tattone D]